MSALNACFDENEEELSMRRRWNEYDDWPESPRGRRTKRLWPTALAGLAVAYIVGIFSGAAIVHTGNSNSVSYVPAKRSPNSGQQNGASTAQTGGSNASQNAGTGATSLPGVSGSNLVTGIYNQSKSSIFTITAVSGSSNSKSSGPQEDIGTGFLIDNHGDVATNAHVVGSSKTVDVAGNNHTYKGTVVNADKLDDLAIVHINAPSTLSPLPLGSVKTLQPGNLVIAIGNPFQLTASVSSGIVSGLNRSMSESGGHVMNGMIQTDAPLNPGNSGGPLFNASGKVVGINTLIESPIQGSIGIGFAIPIDRLVALEQKLLSGKSIEHAWLGIEGMDIDSLMQSEMKLPSSSGVYVTQVTKNGPAAKAGLHGDSNAGKLKNASPNQLTDPFKILKGDGDIIIGVGGKPIQTIEQLTQVINQDQPGDSVTLTILRNGKKTDVSVKLGKWPGK